MLKIELGGGRNPHKRAEGYLNVDVLDAPEVDVRLDLDAPGLRLPWPDDSVGAVYSCHCLEHLADYRPLLAELCRVCPAGAEVYVRVPHWLHGCALIHGHRGTLPEVYVRRWPEYGIGVAHGKRLELRRVHYEPEVHFGTVGRKFRKLGLSDEEILRFVPDMAHEVHYAFEVVGA